jgi:hypothetical protein
VSPKPHAQKLHGSFLLCVAALYIGDGMAQGQRKEPRKESGWLPKSMMLRIFDRGTFSFDRFLVPILPESCIRTGPKRRKEYYAREVLDAWLNHELERRTAVNNNGHSAKADAQLRISDLKARRLELQLMSEIGSWVPRSGIDELHERVGTMLREVMVKLQAKYGREAGEIFIEAIEAAEREMTRALDDGKGDGDTSA